MKKYLSKIILFCILFLAYSTCAFSLPEDWNIISDKIVLGLNLTGNIDIDNPSNVEMLEISLGYFPRNTSSQKVYYDSIFPSSGLKSISEDKILFSFNRLVSNELKYGLISTIEVDNSMVQIPSKIEFPIREYNSEMKRFVLPSFTIDSDNEKIIELARSLSSGEDDLYKVVINFAHWINMNVNYSLTSVNIGATFDASTVLRTKQGVCDEITNLFIALCRSQGIPARFVSGISYTNDERFIESFGPHGWAEVYFPEIGWVPFDVTYRQYGYVDATHIILATSLDATEETTNYRWKEKGSKVTPGQLNSNVNVISVEGNTSGLIIGEPYVFSQDISSGSYNLVIMEAENTLPSYLTADFVLADVSIIETISNKTQTIVFSPLERKKIYWVIRANAVLNENSWYSVPVIVADSFRDYFSTSFNIQSVGEMLSYETIDAYLNAQEEFQEKPEEEESSLSFSCSPASTNEIYQNTSVPVTCDVTSISPDMIAGVKLCADSECQSFDIEAYGSKRISFTKFIEKAGANLIVFQLSYREKLQNLMLALHAIDKPAAKISEMSYPLNVAYDDLFELSFNVEKSSLSVPKTANISIKHPVFDKYIYLGDLDGSQDITIKITGSSLNLGENTILLNLTYFDDKGQKYSLEQNIKINLIKATFFQKIKIHLRNFSLWLGKHS